MEKEIRIQDDLYHAVNQEKLDQIEIPADRPVAGGFSELDEGVEKTMMGEFASLSKSREFPNSYIENAVNLYDLGVNVKKRNKQGIKPILKDLQAIASLSDIGALNRKLAAFITKGYPLPFDIRVEPDMKDSNRHSLYLYGPTTILPDTTMYSDANPRRDAMLGAFEQIARKALTYTSLTAEEQDLYVKDTLAFDRVISTLVKSREEWSEYTKIYNPYKVNKAARLLKPIKIKSALKKLFGQIPEQIIVADPRFLAGFDSLFNEAAFAQYLHWAYVGFLIDNATYLSEELRDLAGAFRRALMGVAKMTEPKKFSYQLASRYFSEPLGLYYGEKYFGEEAKKDVVEMVHEIIAAYKERIAKNDILEDATKEKAIRKLDTMKVKMGYPDAIDPLYGQFIVTPRDTLYGAVAKIRLAMTLDNFSKLYEPVDKTKWAMPGHMVNACYDPTANDITFPAAILQAPFYSIKQSRSENLGGIGAVIGHEISHAFDNNGAKCDENGNLNNWWTKADFKRFDKKVKAMIAQFDGIELPWGKVNGKLVVSENIADNGGVAVTLHIMKKMPEADYEAYFKNWARVWCQKAKEEYKAMLLTVDVHGPTVLRANMPPRNFEEWYKTFDVKKTDQMYIAPNKRIVIW